VARGSGEGIGFQEIHTQLRIANRLKAAELKSSLGQQEVVRLLAGTGATMAEIADILGTTAATVNTTFQRLKRRARRSDQVSGDEGEAVTGGTDV